MKINIYGSRKVSLIFSTINSSKIAMNNYLIYSATKEAYKEMVSSIFDILYDLKKKKHIRFHEASSLPYFYSKQILTNPFLVM